MCFGRNLGSIQSTSCVTAEDAEAQPAIGGGDKGSRISQFASKEPRLESGTLVPVPSWVPANPFSYQPFRRASKERTESRLREQQPT